MKRLKRRLLSALLSVSLIVSSYGSPVYAQPDTDSEAETEEYGPEQQSEETTVSETAQNNVPDANDDDKESIVSDNDAEDAISEEAGNAADWYTIGYLNSLGHGILNHYPFEEDFNLELQIYMNPTTMPINGESMFMYYTSGEAHYELTAIKIIEDPSKYSFRLKICPPSSGTNGINNGSSVYAYILDSIDDATLSNFVYKNGKYYACEASEHSNLGPFDFSYFKPYIQHIIIEDSFCSDPSKKCRIDRVTTAIFANMTGLKSFSAPYVSAYANGFFSGCSNLETVTLGVNPYNPIPESCYQGCTKLSSVKYQGYELKEAAIRFEKNSFYGCPTYISGAFDCRGKTIGEGAFANCGITSLTVDNVPAWAFSTRFAGNSANMTITYTTATSIPCPDIPVAAIVADAAATALTGFAGNGYITTINAAKVTSIGAGQFKGCTRLTTMNFTDNLASIPDNAFNGCTSLSAISIKAATSVGISAFAGCTNLTNVTIADKLATIGESAFNGCAKLKSFPLDTVTTIGNSAFVGCATLDTAYLEKATTIGTEAFKGCTGLTTVNVLAATAIGVGVFSGCTKLSSVNVDNVTSFDNDCFNGCPIATLDLSKAKTIGERAFNGCTSLTSLLLRDVIYVSADAFKGIAATELSIPTKHDITMEAGAFVGTLQKVIYDDTEKNFEQYVSIPGRTEVFGSATFEFVKEEDPDDPKDPEDPEDPDKPDPVIEDNLALHTIVYYYYKNDTPTVSVEKDIVEGTLATNVPLDTAKTGYDFEGWYRLETLSSQHPVKWDSYSPVYENLVLCGVYTKDNQTIIIVPNVPDPTSAIVDPNTPTSPKELDPNSDTKITLRHDPNPMPTLGGTGDPNASALDSYIDFESFTTGRDIYMVKGQKVKLVKGIIKVSSDNKKILTAKKKYVKANKVGKATLTVEFKATGQKVTHNVTIIDPAMKTKNRTMLAGKSARISFPVDSELSKYPILWTSSNPDVFSVETEQSSNITKVHAVGKGTATLTCYINGKAYKTKVTVKDAIKWTEAQKKYYLVPLQTVNLKDKAYLGSFYKPGLKYSYSKEGIVTVDKNGKLSVIGTGEVTVTATYGTTSKQLVISVSQTSPRIVHLNVNKTQTLAPYNVDRNAAKWTVTGTDVISNEKGKISAIAPGAATVTATYKGYTYRYYIYVDDPNIADTSVIEKSGKSLKLDMKRGDLVKVSPANLHQTIYYISKNPEIAFMDENGYVRARYTGKAKFESSLNKKKIKIKSKIS